MSESDRLNTRKPADITDSVGFSDSVLTWFDRHGRKDLPWQQQVSPYRVWVSEIMLQQTQVITVIPYFLRFMAQFPDVQALAGAREDDVLHLWSGLGYYSRARNLHRAACYLLSEYQGQFPADVEALSRLPGVGRSTAGAIAAIALGIRAPILDGNVKRVLARYQAVSGWPGTAAVTRTLWALSERYTPAERVADYTQAMMDLGALICTRRQPACHCCPLVASCQAYRQGEATAFPTPRPRKKLPEKAVRMLMLIRPGGSQVLLQKRPSAGLWGGLWSFPEADSAQADGQVAEALGLALARVEEWPAFRHTFSHFHLRITPVRAWLEPASGAVPVLPSERWQWHRLDQPARLGLAAPVKKLLVQLGQAAAKK